MNIVDCETNGDLGTGEVNWQISNPDGADADTNPDGQEYIVPLCKTGGGSFMILDLDGTPNNCDDEVDEPARDPVRRPSRSTSSPTTATTAPSRWSTRSTPSPARSCSSPSATVTVSTSGGSNAVYHVIRVAAFYLDYMSDQNGGNNLACQGNGTTLITIARQRQHELPRRLVRPLHHVRAGRRRARSREPARSASSSSSSARAAAGTAVA